MWSGIDTIKAKNIIYEDNFFVCINKNKNNEIGIIIIIIIIYNNNNDNNNDQIISSKLFPLKIYMPQN